MAKKYRGCPTVYKGVLMRSKTEAAAAVWLEDEG